MDKSTQEVMFSSATDLWSTPQEFFDKLNAEFGPFDLDVCASAENAKCAAYFDREMNGLSLEWVLTLAGKPGSSDFEIGRAKCWMNPPYGREIGKWVKKAWEESVRNGAVVCCLLPARTDTKWWHEYCAKASVIRFVKGRLKFGGSKNSAPFPSVVVVFGVKNETGKLG